MSETVWGALFMVYLLAGLPVWAMQMEEQDKPDFSPRTSKLTWGWIAGLCALVLAWVVSQS